MGDTRIDLTVDGPIATACFATEGGLNVLSIAVLNRLLELTTQVRAKAGIRVLVLGGAGKVFLAGANIKELSGLDTAGAAEVSRLGNKVFDAIAELPIITIARMHGATLGGGLELALACDFRVAVGGAMIGLPETSLGLIPGWHGVNRMLALAGPSATKRLVFGASVIKASEARRLGIVDEEVADVAELDTKIKSMITQFLRGSPNAVALTKQVVRDGDDVRAFAACYEHPEAQEGMKAFLEKREADWMKG